MRLKETKDAELVRSSVPIAGENDGYVDAQPEIEDCSNGFAPQPNTTADGSQKMIVPVVLSMTSYLFSHYRLQMYTYLNRSLRNGSGSLRWCMTLMNSASGRGSARGAFSARPCLRP